MAITIYPIDIDSDSYNNIYYTMTPEGYDQIWLYTRYHSISNCWYHRIQYTSSSNNYTIDTDWRMLVVSPSLNYEYQNVMKYSIGFMTDTEFSPIGETGIRDTNGQFYLISWNDLFNL